MNEAPTLELEVDDGTAAISAVFLGRRQLAGVGVGLEAGAGRARSASTASGSPC